NDACGTARIGGGALDCRRLASTCSVTAREPSRRRSRNHIPNRCHAVRIGSSAKGLPEILMSPADALEPLRSALEQAGIRYAVGDSWASTAFREPRFRVKRV